VRRGGRGESPPPLCHPALITLCGCTPFDTSCSYFAVDVSFTSFSIVRYADRAKQIVNKAFVNEDTTAAIIRGLMEELQVLKSAVGTASMTQDEADTLRENERLLREEQQTWEEKLKTTETELQAHIESAEREANELRVEVNTLQRLRSNTMSAAETQLSELNRRLEEEKNQRQQLQDSLAGHSTRATPGDVRVCTHTHTHTHTPPTHPRTALPLLPTLSFTICPRYVPLQSRPQNFMQSTPAAAVVNAKLSDPLSTQNVQ
jgi:hypothetical protein